MEVIRRQYYRFLLLFMIMLCGLCIALSLLAIRSTENAHAVQTYQQLYAIKRVFLKDTVQNMIRTIDRLRAYNRASAINHIDQIAADLKRLYSRSPADFEETSRDLLRYQEYRDCMNIRLETASPGKILYETGQHAGIERFSGITEMVKTLFSVESRFGPYVLKLGVNEEWVDGQTKSSVAELIHSQTFENDGYIWVNEIQNWDGGDNYAIRRIHPNLISTEGSFLSTNTTDGKGNRPYLMELDGVKRHGEIYYRYFFKRKGSEAVAEKLSYAALYKEYNWIVGMGMYIDDVQVYIDSVQQASRVMTTRLIGAEAAFVCLLFIGGIFILSRMEKWYLQRTSHAVREESNTDPLTGALNRRMGAVYIGDSFKRFHRKLDDPVFFSFDVDNFKSVNDAYGHDAGDVVLKSIVEQIGQNMRVTDRLFRWGGEEFLLMCYGVEHDSALVLAGKLNRAIALTPIVIGKTDKPPTCNFDLETCAYNACNFEDRFSRLCIDRDGDMIIHVSISIGVSWFNETDIDSAAALTRADQAMYRAKADGKNCSRLG